MQNPHNEENLSAPISGALLAGGRSTRMHSDKAQLAPTPFGLPLASRGLRTLQAVCADIFIAGDRPDLASAGVKSYADRSPGSSLGGLETALRHAQHDWVCVLPCDLPYPSASLLHALLAARTEDTQAVVPRTAHGIEPLIACYRRDALQLIEQQLAQGEFRLIRLLEQLQTRYVEATDLPSGWRRALYNLNTPADLQRLNAAPPVVSFVASSGTGKTTLIEQVIACLDRRGWTVGALKHDAHRFEIDHPGKDTWRMTAAGATVTAISSGSKSALMWRHDLEPGVEELLAQFSGRVDILITEGFKRSQLPKIEVYRHELDRPLLCRGAQNDPTLIAIASNTSLTADVPLLPLNAPEAVADFIEQRFLT